MYAHEKFVFFLHWLMIYKFIYYVGHGGSRAAEYLKQFLFENLMKHPKFMEDTKAAISASTLAIISSISFQFTT